MLPGTGCAFNYTNDTAILKPSRERIVVDMYTLKRNLSSVFSWSGAGMSVTASSLLCYSCSCIFFSCFGFHFPQLTQSNYQLNFNVVLIVIYFITLAVGGRFELKKTCLTPPQRVCACPKPGILSLCVSRWFTFLVYFMYRGV